MLAVPISTARENASVRPLSSRKSQMSDDPAAGWALEPGKGIGRERGKELGRGIARESAKGPGRGFGKESAKDLGRGPDSGHR